MGCLYNKANLFLYNELAYSQKDSTTEIEKDGLFVKWVKKISFCKMNSLIIPTKWKKRWVVCIMNSKYLVYLNELSFPR